MSRAALLDSYLIRSCALVLTLFLFQKGQGFFPSLPIAARLPRSWRGDILNPCRGDALAWLVFFRKAKGQREIKSTLAFSASHEARRRMAVWARQQTKKHIKPASREACRRAAVTPQPTCFPSSGPAPIGRGGTRGKAAWLRSYRRSATGLAARRSGVASCQLNRKDRHSATGLMARNKGQRGYEIPLAFCVAKISKLHQSIQLGGLSMIIYTNRRAKTKSAVLRCKAISATSKHPKHRRLSLLSANCGGAERR